MTTKNDDAAQLKSRRRTGARPVSTVPTTALSEALAEPDQPPASVSAAIARNTSKILFSPGEKPAIVQSAGFVPESILDEYVVADCDVSESSVPRNATTPITKQLWCKGALVRKDIYALYVKLRAVAAQAQDDNPQE